MLFDDCIRNCHFMFCAAYGYNFLRLEIVDMKTQYVFIFNSVRNGIGVQLFLKNVFGGYIRANCSVNFFVSSIFIKNGSAGKPE
jgi:hypothetical protein